MFDTEFIVKALALVLGGGTVAALVKFGTRWLELRYQERKELRDADRAEETGAPDKQKQIYGDLIERLGHEIERLNSEADVSDRRQANNLSLFKDFAEKTQIEVSRCHEERRCDRAEYRKRIKHEIIKRRALEERLSALEAALAKQAEEFARIRARYEADLKNRDALIHRLQQSTTEDLS